MIKTIRNSIPAIALYTNSRKTQSDHDSPPSLRCEDYQHLLRKALSEDNPMPRAFGGKTPVYLPKEAPTIALKFSGNEAANSRLKQMESIRAILEEQKSEDLIIPKATICGEFLLEERLPVWGELYYNMGIYTANSSLFDEAVREMVRFSSKAYLSDLVDYQKNFPPNLIVGDSVRYDNIPLYIEEKNGIKKGKIGLIDLEHSWIPHQSINDEYFPLRIFQLARIFPYHADLIIDEAKKLNKPLDEAGIKKIQEQASKGNKYLKKAYIEHYDFIKKKEITNESWKEPFIISTEKRITITQKIEKKIENRFMDSFYTYRRPHLKTLITKGPIGFIKNIHAPKQRKLANQFASEITPLLLELIESTIKKEQNYMVTKTEGSAKCISTRSLFFRFRLWEDEHLKKILDNIWNEEKIPIDSEDIISIVLEELVSAEEIYSFKKEHTSYFWIQI